MIKVEFKPEDMARLKAAMVKLSVSAHEQAENKIPKLGAIQFRDRVADAILSQKYVGIDWDYSESYADWKAAQGKNDGYWRLAGDLVASLSISKLGNGWFSGVPVGIKDSGGKSYGKGKSRDIAWYGRIIEWGGIFNSSQGAQTHKPRPVFVPTLKEFAAIDWPRIGSQALIELSKSWE